MTKHELPELRPGALDNLALRYIAGQHPLSEKTMKLKEYQRPTVGFGARAVAWVVKNLGWLALIGAFLFLCHQIAFGQDTKTECIIAAVVQEPTGETDRNVHPDKLLAIKVSAIGEGCSPHLDQARMTVETSAAHNIAPGMKVKLGTFEETPHGRIVVRVLDVR